MMVLVVGASGATGRELVRHLIHRGLQVRAIVRSPDKLPDDLKSHAHLSVIRAHLSELTVADLTPLVQGCDAVASCLGHNPTLRGILGPPRLLVAEATRRLCEAIRAAQPHPPESPVRFVLMSTAGIRNRDLAERVSLGHRFLLGLIRCLLPPHRDNERAADHLREKVGQENPHIAWVVVRPDTLTGEDVVTAYDVHDSPIRSALFDPGRTSRINVGHFMATLMTEDALWSRWRGRMPVIYNTRSVPSS